MSVTVFASVMPVIASVSEAIQRLLPAALGHWIAQLSSQRRSLLLLLPLILILINTACSNSDAAHHPKPQQYRVTANALHKSLYYTGHIQPLHETAIVSPMDAVVDLMSYRYGQLVEKDKTILTLNSPALQQLYDETLTEYLKAKDSYSVAKAKFMGTENLWKAGLLAKNNFLSEKSNLDTAHVTLLQSSKKLKSLLEKMDKSASKELSRLDIAEFKKVEQALSGQHHFIHLKAQNSGILLYPPKSGEDKSGQITVGSSVKAGQVLALLGDLSGIRVEIEVPETDIGKIYPGMKAIVTGVALGNARLQGKVLAVNSQAFSNNGNNALPSFGAVIEVKNLSAKEQAVLKVGMSAAIELLIEEKKELRIPIAAVKPIEGKSVVKVQTADGRVHIKPIQIAATEMDKVVVAAGLNAGDVVLYD